MGHCGNAILDDAYIFILFQGGQYRYFEFVVAHFSTRALFYPDVFWFLLTLTNQTDSLSSAQSGWIWHIFNVVITAPLVLLLNISSKYCLVIFCLFSTEFEWPVWISAKHIEQDGDFVWIVNNGCSGKQHNPRVLGTHNEFIRSPDKVSLRPNFSQFSRQNCAPHRSPRLCIW